MSKLLGIGLITFAILLTGSMALPHINKRIIPKHKPDSMYDFLNDDYKNSIKKIKRKRQPKYIREGWKKLYVRITHYSPKEPGEMSINHKGKKIRNEKGVAFPSIYRYKYDNKEVYVPGVGYRIFDDTIPRRTWRKHYRRGVDVFDVRWYQSVTYRQCRRNLRHKGVQYKYIYIKTN